MCDENNTETKKYVIFVFENSHLAIKSEIATKKKFSNVARLIPLPPEVSAGCGMVLRSEMTDAKDVYNCLQNAQVEIEDAYILSISGKKRSVEKFNL